MVAAGSVHTRAWPTAEEVVEPIGGRDAERGHVFEQTRAALGEIRRIKALQKKPAKAVIDARRAAAAFRVAARPPRRTSRRRRTSATWHSDRSTEAQLEFAAEPAAGTARVNRAARAARCR